jgi:hypothetical protein
MNTAETRVPRSDEEVATLLTMKPPGWEYLLYGGELLRGVQGLEQRYQDYIIGYAPRTGKVVHPDCFAGYIQSQVCELEVIVDLLNVLIGDGSAIQDAMGPPGVPGDPDTISHAASRIIRLYEDFLLWAERIRGNAMPSGERKVADAMARFAAQPLSELRDFVFRYVAQADQIPAKLSRNEQVVISETITFKISDEISHEFSRHLDELKERR